MARKYRVDRVLILPVYNLVQRLRGKRPSGEGVVLAITPDCGSAHGRRLSAVELTKRFGDVTAVSDLSFEVEAGSVTGFLGPNGAGKTTTLRMLLGLAEPTHGHALVFGRRFAELERPATRVGAVLEASDLHPGRSGRDHLRVLARAARVPAGRVEEVLALVELARWRIAARRATRSGCASASASRPPCSAIPSC